MSDNRTYIIAAYLITWVALIGYAVRLHVVAQRARAQHAAAERGEVSP